MNARFLFAICLAIAVPAASQEPLRGHRTFVDSIGVFMDSLPTLTDSFFVKDRKYEFTGVKASGDETGLDVYDELTLNLSLEVGEQEERDISGFSKVLYGIGNFIVRLGTLTFYDPGFGSDRYFFDHEILDADMHRIRQMYEAKGYYQTKIAWYRARVDYDSKVVTIRIAIREGHPVRLTKDPEITVISPIPIVDSKRELTSDELQKLLPLRKGDPLARDQVEYTKTVLARHFSQRGYPAAEIQEKIDTTGWASRQAAVQYMITPGRFTVFGNTEIRGNYYKKSGSDTTARIVEDDVILKKVRYKKGRPYNPDDLSLSVGQINGLGVFRTVKPSANRVKGTIDSTRVLPKFIIDSLLARSDNRLHLKKADYRSYGVPVDTMNIALTVSEKKERSIKPGVGFTTDFVDLPEDNNAVLPFTRLLVTWQSKNFLGGARKLQISGEISKGFEKTDFFFTNYMIAKVTFRQPSFRLPFTSDVNNDLVTTVSFERNSTKAFDLRKLDVSPTFLRQITSRLSMNLTPLSFSRATELIVGAPNNVFFTTDQKLGFAYNSSNDFFNPTSGFLIYLNGDAAGFTLPSDLKYFKWNVDVRRYIGLSSRLSLATRVHVAAAIPYYVDGQLTQVPASEQFYAGGPNSIRGWGIRELGILHIVDGRLAYFGGNSILETGAEFRYNLFISRDPTEAIGGMDLAVFYDAGNVWTNDNFTNAKDAGGNTLPSRVLGAVGVGLRVRTLIGPLRVDFGYKLIDPKNLKAIDENGLVVPLTSAQAKDISRLAFQITLGQAY